MNPRMGKRFDERIYPKKGELLLVTGVFSVVQYNPTTLPMFLPVGSMLLIVSIEDKNVVHGLTQTGAMVKFVGPLSKTRADFVRSR